MKPFRDISAALGVILACGLATAQVAPPPPAKPAPTQPFIAPIPSTKPNAPRAPSPTQAAADTAKKAQATAEQIDFETLAEKGPDGKIKPLPEPIEWYALKRNPIVKPIRLAMCEPVLRDRKSRIESLVIDNVDIMERLDSGLIAQLDMTDKSRISELVQLIKPFQSLGTMTADLKKQKALDDTQAAVNQRMVNDYIKRKTAELNAEEGVEAAPKGEKPANGEVPKQVGIMTRLMLEIAMGESTYFYNKIVLDAAGHLGELGLDKMGVDKAILDRVSAATTDQDKTDAMKRALEKLSLEQKREVLRKAVALRPPPPPLPDPKAMADEAVASGGGVIMWKGPKGLIEKRIALHEKVTASKMAATEASKAVVEAGKPDAPDDVKKAATDAIAKAEQAKKDEEAARTVLLDFIKEHPELKKYLTDAAAKADGTYFEPEAKASESGDKADPAPAKEEKK